MAFKNIITGLTLLFLLGNGVVVADGWEVTSFKDDFTDKAFYEINMRSNDDDTRLGLQCKEGGLGLFVNTKTYLNNDDIPLRLRVDKGDVYDGMWRASADGTMAIASQNVSERFIPKLALVNEIVVKVTDYRGVGYTSRFENFDEGKVFQNFLTLCGLEELALMTTDQIKEAQIQDEKAKARADQKWGSNPPAEKAVERFIDLIGSNAKDSNYPSRQCITSSLVTLGFLNKRNEKYTKPEMRAALLNYLNSMLYTCRTEVTDDITLEIRCDAYDYEGLLKYASSMAAKIDSAESDACQR